MKKSIFILLYLQLIFFNSITCLFTPQPCESEVKKYETCTTTTFLLAISCPRNNSSSNSSSNTCFFNNFFGGLILCDLAVPKECRSTVLGTNE